ncbi:uncharacterized protein LOC112451619 [Temnothorax curvispinosus]|uniref:Uncharacterized protein LOC112451619 n=1 Tax=Temnothorax curvispinosus TaxID=300111 RepID=A0A6J1PCW2_9HYME|nr:uncharacterized protein LOC112451619 [Temnothorax curvispinosus]
MNQQRSNWFRVRSAGLPVNEEPSRRSSIILARSKHTMCAGVESILCVILGVSGILMSHLANSNPYRGNYTVTRSQYDRSENKIFKENKVLDEESGLQNAHNDREMHLCLNSKGREEERIVFAEANNQLQNTPRELSGSDDDDDDADDYRGFSLFGLVESMLSVVASGLSTVVNSIVGTEKKDSRSRTSRINYRNYHLIRAFPNTESQAADLRDLRDAEPEDIKFWSFPNPNRTADMIVAPDLVNDVKEYLRDKKIDFKVLISDIQKTISYQNPKMSKEQREDLVTTQGHTMTWKRYHRYADLELTRTAFFRGVAPYDIAVLKLKTPLVLNERVSAVNLPKENEVRTGNAVLSGWGSISKRLLPKLPKVLQKVTVPLLDSESCQAKFPPNDTPKVTDTMICTDAIGEISACSGDSGGPLVQLENNTPTQVGIVSWGVYPCGVNRMPSVYTRVASYITWIKSKTSL